MLQDLCYLLKTATSKCINTLIFEVHSILEYTLPAWFRPIMKANFEQPTSNQLVSIRLMNTGSLDSLVGESTA